MVSQLGALKDVRRCGHLTPHHPVMVEDMTGERVQIVDCFQNTPYSEFKNEMFPGDIMDFKAL